MKGILRRLRPSPAMVVACIALVFAMTGAGYAAGMLGPNTVGTKQLKKNAVISSKVKNGSLLRADFKAGQIPRGPQGPQGPQGIQGVQGVQGGQGPAGPGARWVRVSPNGAIVIQSGGITITKTSTGQYLLDFGANVARQMIVTSNGVALDDPMIRGSIHAGPCAGPAGTEFLTPCGGVVNPNKVAVFTLNPTNSAFADHAFYLAVMGPDAPAASMPGKAPRRTSGPVLSR